MLDALCVLCAYLIGVFSAYFFLTRKNKPATTITGTLSTATATFAKEQQPVRQRGLGKRTAIYLTPEHEAEKAREARDTDGKA